MPLAFRIGAKLETENFPLLLPLRFQNKILAKILKKYYFYRKNMFYKNFRDFPRKFSMNEMSYPIPLLEF
jgi:hypothetical protein